MLRSRVPIDVSLLLGGLPLAAFLARLTESTLREQMDEGYVRTARAKGLGKRRSSTATRCRSSRPRWRR